MNVEGLTVAETRKVLGYVSTSEKDGDIHRKHESLSGNFIHTTQEVVEDNAARCLLAWPGLTGGYERVWRLEAVLVGQVDKKDAQATANKLEAAHLRKRADELEGN